MYLKFADRNIGWPIFECLSVVLCPSLSPCVCVCISLCLCICVHLSRNSESVSACVCVQRICLLDLIQRTNLSLLMNKNHHHHHHYRGLAVHFFSYPQPCQCYVLSLLVLTSLSTMMSTVSVTSLVRYSLTAILLLVVRVYQSARKRQLAERTYVLAQMFYFFPSARSPRCVGRPA